MNLITTGVFDQGGCRGGALLLLTFSIQVYRCMNLITTDVFNQGGCRGSALLLLTFSIKVGGGGRCMYLTFSIKLGVGDRYMYLTGLGERCMYLTGVVPNRCRGECMCLILLTIHSIKTIIFILIIIMIIIVIIIITTPHPRKQKVLMRSELLRPAVMCVPVSILAPLLGAIYGTIMALHQGVCRCASFHMCLVEVLKVRVCMCLANCI